MEMSSREFAEALEEFCVHVGNAVDAEVDDEDPSPEDVRRILNECSSELQSLRFFQMIRDPVEACVSDVVERRLQSARRDVRHDTVSQNFVDKLSRNGEFLRTKRQILGQCRAAVESLKTGKTPTCSPAGSEIPKSINSSITTAWLGQSMSYFPGENILNRAVAILRKQSVGNPAISASQSEVLIQLNQVPAMELAQSTQYANLCRSLKEPLRNPDVASEARIFLAKMFNVHSPSVTVLTFVSCAEFLKEWSEEVERSSAASTVLDLSREPLLQYLMLFRLWHQMLSALCGVWLRFPENLVSDAISAVVELLSSCVRSEVQESYSLGNPVLCLSLLDLDAGWFRAWMHAGYGRRRMVAAMKNQPAFLRYILRVSLYADTEFSPVFSTEEQGSDALHFARYERKRALLLYCIRSLSVILQYTEAHRCLFPADLFENSRSNLTAGSCLNKLIRRRLCEEEAPIQVVLATRKCILSLSIAGKRTQLIFFQPEVVEAICNCLTGKRTRREGKLTAVQVLVNLFRTGFKDVEQQLLGAYSSFIVDYCSGLVRLAAEEDHAAPLNLVLAAVDLCRCILDWRETKQLLKKKGFVADLALFVKERAVDPEILLPFLAAFDFPDDSLKRYRRSLFMSEFASYVATAIEIGPTLLDCFVKQINAYLRACGRMNSSTGRCLENGWNHFSLENGHFLPAMPSLIFMAVSLPGMSGSCAQSERFIQFINNFFDQLSQFPASVLAAGFGFLSLLAVNLDFASVMERQFDFCTRIKEKLISYCCQMGETDEIIISRLSFGLVQLFLYLKLIGGSKEKNALQNLSQRFPRSMKVLENNCGSYFQCELSRCLVKQISMNMEELPKGKELITFLLESVASRQKVPYGAILLQFVSEAEAGLGFFRNKEVRDQDWQAVLDYGENLKIIKDRKKALNEIRSLIAEVPYGTKSGGGATDWFLAVVILLMEINSENIILFLRKFSSFLHSKTIWSYLAGADTYTYYLVEEVLPLTERLLERELPQVKAALAISGIPLISVLHIWLNQCFLNILDWPEVCSYLTLSAVGGVSYQVYFVLAVFKHMEEEISKSVIYSAFPSVLVTGTTKHFKLHNYISFLKELENKY